MPNHIMIIDEVRAGLECDPRLPHPMEVAVSEQGGTVTLRGSVGSFHQRHAARPDRHVGPWRAWRAWR